MAERTFEVTITPVTASPLLRDMHTHKRRFKAPDFATAQRMVKEADQCDWSLSDLREVSAP